MIATSRHAEWLQEIVPPRGPARILCTGGFTTAIGDGAWYTVWAIYFTRIIHLSPGQVGIALTAAGAVALAVITPAGHLGDLLGLKGTLITTLAIDAAAMACYTLTGSFWSLLAIAAVATSTDQAASGLRDALTSRLTTGQGKFSLLAQERSAHQLGFAAGAALGALVLALGTRPAFLAVIIMNSATSFANSAWLLRLPRLPVQARPDKPWTLPVVRDLPYLTVIGLTAVLALCWGLLSTGIPLWITHHTHEPMFLAAIIIVLNTLGIAVFQVRASRNSDQPRSAARKATYSGAALALACLLFAATYHGHGWPAGALMLAGGSAELLGELFFVAALWGLSIGLRPADTAAGQYQGMATTGVALASLFTAVAGLTIPATRRALRHRPTSIS